MNTKICISCKSEKFSTEFRKNRHNDDGIDNVCSCCRKDYESKYRHDNPEKVQKRKKKYRLNNPEKIKEYYKNNPGKFNKKRSDDIKIKQNIKDNISIKELTDRYVKRVLKGKYKLSIKTINEQPELIEQYRIHLKIKRLLKNKNNESKNAS